ncbi:MAG: hypothetical protein U0521_29530 [Anaerolineae bacterium]
MFPAIRRITPELQWRISEGAPVNLTAITTTPHVGTHADAYFHYERDGAHPAAMPLELRIGRARGQQMGGARGFNDATTCPRASLAAWSGC